MKITVNTENNIHVYETETQETVLSFLRRNGYAVNAPCGGLGKCSSCSLMINGRMQSACHTYTEDDMVICCDDKRTSHAISKRNIMAAVDLGTTTVHVRLIDAVTKEEITLLTFDNPQKSFGADVVTRADLAKDEEMLKQMSTAVCQRLIEACAPYGTIVKAAFAGNTIMQSILTMHNPFSITVYPFTAPTLFHNERITLPLLSEAEVQCVPCIASYCGGDCTAGVLATELLHTEMTAMFIDIGTNGELVLTKNGRLYACSVPAGPAFEGGEITCGCSDPEHGIIAFDAQQTLTYTCRAEQPAGICGSGVIDLLACMLRMGILDETGYLPEADEVDEEYRHYIEEDEDGRSIFRLSDSIIFTYKDIRMLQMAIAAMSAGISALLIETQTKAEEIEAVYLSGSFGTHLNTDNCIQIGMFPKAWQNHFITAGNTSLTGASMLLQDNKKYQEALQIAKTAVYIELSASDAFKTQYTEFMFLTEDKQWNSISL